MLHRFPTLRQLKKHFALVGLTLSFKELIIYHTGNFSVKERVENLIKKGLMRDAGYEIIEKSKSNGYWNLFDDAENLILPDELISNLLSNLTVKRGCLISRFLENRRWRLFY